MSSAYCSLCRAVAFVLLSFLLNRLVWIVPLFYSCILSLQVFRDLNKVMDPNHLTIGTCERRGKIQLIFGPMFSGKSTELLRRLKRYQVGGFLYTVLFFLIFLFVR